MCADNLSDDIHKSTSRLVLNYGQLEYADVCQVWRDIESKAQGVVAIAGIFIAGVFALVQQLSRAPCWAVSTLVGVLILLVAAVLCAIRALFVSECECLEPTAQIIERANRVIGSRSEEEGKEEWNSPGFIDT